LVSALFNTKSRVERFAGDPTLLRRWCSLGDGERERNREALIFAGPPESLPAGFRSEESRRWTASILSDSQVYRKVDSLRSLGFSGIPEVSVKGEKQARNL
jgi:hypothetical protein